MTDPRKTIDNIVRAWLDDGTHARIKHPGRKGVADMRAVDATSIENIAVNIDAMMEDGELLKDGGACKVAAISLNGRPIVVKRYNWRGWMKGLRYMIKGSRARHVWFYGHVLPEIGVRTPPPVAWLEHSKHGMVRQSYIMTEFVDGTKLYDYICDENRSHDERRAILDKMELVFDRLHGHRMTHGDMKRSNVLVVDGEICLIDLDAVALHRCTFVHMLKRRRDLKRFLERISGESLPGHLRRRCRHMVRRRLKDTR